MTKLADDIKLFIVQQLACFDKPAKVVEEVSVEFGIKIERGQIQKYDPTKVAGKGLGKKYKEIFEATRESFLNETIQMPVTKKLYRIRLLEHILEKYLHKNNLVQAALIIEQIAKESSNYYMPKAQVGDDHEGQIITMLKNFKGGSLPIIYDVNAKDDQSFSDRLLKSHPQEVNDSVELTKLKHKPIWNPPK